MSIVNYFKKLSFKVPPPKSESKEPEEEDEKREAPYHTDTTPFTWTCDGYPPTPFISDHHWFNETYFKKGGDESEVKNLP